MLGPPFSFRFMDFGAAKDSSNRRTERCLILSVLWVLGQILPRNWCCQIGGPTQYHYFELSSESALDLRCQVSILIFVSCTRHYCTLGAIFRNHLFPLFRFWNER